MIHTPPSPSRHRERDQTQEPATIAAGERPHGLTALSLFLVLLACWVLLQVKLVLILTLLALVFGTIIEHPIQKLEQRHIPRAAAILIIYIAIIGTIAVFGWAIAPAITDQAHTFQQQVPGQLRELEESWRASGNPLLNGPGAQTLNRVIGWFNSPGSVPISSDKAAAAAVPILTSIFAGIVATVTLLVITFYYLMEKAFLRRLLLMQIQPESRARVGRVWDDVEKKVGGWIRGQLILCLILGIVATIAYGSFGLRFWPLLGLWAGVTEIVPIIGPWIGGVPAVLIALTMSWKMAVIVGFVILGLHLLENWILVPRVMRGAVGLTPLTVFVAILAGTEMLGPVGAVLAIPVAATIQVMLTDCLDSRRGARDSEDRSGWRWMLNRARAGGGPENGGAESAYSNGNGHVAAPSHLTASTERPEPNDSAAPEREPAAVRAEERTARPVSAVKAAQGWSRSALDRSLARPGPAATADDDRAVQTPEDTPKA